MGVFVLEITLRSPHIAGAGVHLSPLFLVCKALRDDAQEVLFKQNRFINAPVEGYGEPAKTVLDRFEASTFLQDIVPPRFLPSFRFLEIVFPPVDEEYLSPRIPALQNWDNLLDGVKNKLDIPNLTLRIYFADFYTATYAAPFRKQITRKEGLTRVVSAYMRIIRPLEKWKANGLHRLFCACCLAVVMDSRGAKHARMEEAYRSERCIGH